MTTDRAEGTDLTVGQAAKVCRVHPRTMKKWFDDGRLPGGYRRPVSQDRMIPRAVLARFLDEYGLPREEPEAMP
jgi:hypothetical protein